MHTVLVADDNLASRELLKDALELCGVRVIEASDGREALTKIQAESPTLVLLDIQMPTMDGFSVLKAMHGLNLSRCAKVIALTAYAMESDRQRVFEAGFDGYISKPISVSDVRKQVQAMIADSDPATNA